MKIGFRAALVAALVAVVSMAALPAQADMHTRVRFAHWSPDAPSVDVYVDGSLLLPGLSFPTVTRYRNLPGGTHTVDVRPAGADPASAPVISETVDLASRTSYTLAAIGTLASIQGAIYQDDRSRPAKGMAKVQAIHAIPDVGPVDVAVASGPVLISSLDFGEASGYVQVPAGSYSLEVRAAGTTTALLTIDVTVENGGVYSVIAQGLAEAGTAELAAVVDRPPFAPGEDPRDDDDDDDDNGEDDDNGDDDNGEDDNGEDDDNEDDD